MFNVLSLIVNRNTKNKNETFSLFSKTIVGRWEVNDFVQNLACVSMYLCSNNIMSKT